MKRGQFMRNVTGAHMFVVWRHPDSRKKLGPSDDRAKQFLRPLQCACALTILERSKTIDQNTQIVVHALALQHEICI